MVKTFPHWNSVRVRSGIVSRDNPGTNFVDYVPCELIYVRDRSGTIQYCIDAENSQIVSEGQPLFAVGQIKSASDNNAVSAFCPIDGTLSIGITTQDENIGQPCCGLTNRHGDTAMLFNVNFNSTGQSGETICDYAQTQSEFIYFSSSIISTSASTISCSLYNCNKSNLGTSSTNLVSVQPIGERGGAAIDADRNGSIYCYVSGSVDPTDAILIKIGGSNWQQRPTNMPIYPPITARLIAVGPPLQSGAVWFQSFYVANPGPVTGWLSQHDCRTGVQTAGGATMIANGWPYNLQAKWINATKDGLIVFNSAALVSQYPNGAIEKLSYANLSLIWRHVPNNVQAGFTGQVTASPTVDSLGNVIYPTIADATGAVHFRKLNGNDGSLAWDHPFWLPIANQPLVSSAGRIGAFPQPGETYTAAGSPGIDAG